jgi:hypothetical protein
VTAVQFVCGPRSSSDSIYFDTAPRKDRVDHANVSNVSRVDEQRIVAQDRQIGLLSGSYATDLIF